MSDTHQTCNRCGSNQLLETAFTTKRNGQYWLTCNACRTIRITKDIQTNSRAVDPERQLALLLNKTLKKHPEFRQDPVVDQFIKSMKNDRTHRSTPDEDDGLTPAEKKEMLKLLR